MKNLTEEQKIFKYVLFKEVAEESLRTFNTKVKNALLDYRALNTNKIFSLSEDQIRRLAFNYITKMLAKELSERQDFYFDKHLEVII